MKEIWKDIPGFDYYQASNLGRVRSKDRFVKHNYGGFKQMKGKTLRTNLSANGYPVVSVYKDGKQKLLYVHRVVAEIFIPNPNNLPQVNHKDEDKTNNSVENLEWCSEEYNYNYGTRTKRCTQANINNKKKSKPVLQFDLEGNMLREWPSLGEIGRVTHKSISSISSCCLNKPKFKTAYGFVWKYKRDIV